MTLTLSKKKMKKADQTSDLDSHVESSGENTETQRKKRKTVKTTITKFASFEVNEDSESESIEKSTALSNLPQPPKFTAVTQKITTQKITPKTTLLGENISEAINAKTNNEDIVDLASGSFDDGFVNLQQISTKRKTDDVERQQYEPNVTGATINSIPDLEQKLDYITEYLKKIVRKQNIIQSTLADLAEDVSEIKNKINTNNPYPVEDSESIFTSVNLPVDSEVDLQSLEEYLSDEIKMISAVKEVSSSGGKDLYELIYRGTQKLVTNKFAAKYSYHGRQKKLKFCSLKLNELLKRNAIKVFPNSSEKEAELAIYKWIRRCAERAKKE